MELNEKLQKAIAEDMSQHVGIELKKLLEQGEYYKNEYQKAKDANNEACSKIGTLSTELANKTNIISEHKKLDEREKEISERERNFQINELTIKLEESEKRATMVQDFTSNLVRNTIVRKSILDSESISQDPYYDNNGNYMTPMPKNTTKSFDETTNEE